MDDEERLLDIGAEGFVMSFEMQISEADKVILI